MKLIPNGLVFLGAATVAFGEPVQPEAAKAAEEPFTVTETEIRLPGITIDRKTLDVRVEATVCLDSGILEYVVCRPDTFEHEAIFTTDAKPELLHAALLLARMKPTPLLPGLTELWWDKALRNKDSRVKIEVEWQEHGVAKRENLTAMLWDRRGKEDGSGSENSPENGVAAQDGWVFTGSFMQADRETGARVYAGNLSGILVGIWPDPSTVIQYGIASGNPYEDAHQGLEINEKRVPKLGTQVKLVFSRHFPGQANEPAGSGDRKESDGGK